MDLVSHSFAGEDLPGVMGLLVAHIAAGRHFDVSVADLRQVLARPSTGSDHHDRVWENTRGEIVGFGLVWPPSNTVLYLVRPDLAEGAVDPPLSEQIVQWMVTHGHEIARECDTATHVRFRPYDDDRALIELIERDGFQAEDWYTPKYARSLDDALPEPSLPPGFTIRHVAGEYEVQEYVALHQDAFGTANMQVEERLSFMRDPDYVPELDLIAVAPDGTLAAFVVAGIDREESRLYGQLTGYTDPLGTRLVYRRQGLARALLYEALRRLQRRGVRVATVGTGSWNTATMGLVESVGFRLKSKVLAFAREWH